MDLLLTMTKKELVELLNEYPDDNMEVFGTQAETKWACDCCANGGLDYELRECEVQTIVKKIKYYDKKECFKNTLKEGLVIGEVNHLKDEPFYVY